jgi:hypothetical protein
MIAYGDRQFADLRAVTELRLIDGPVGEARVYAGSGVELMLFPTSEDAWEVEHSDLPTLQLVLAGSKPTPPPARAIVRRRNVVIIGPLRAVRRAAARFR